MNRNSPHLSSHVIHVPRNEHYHLLTIRKGSKHAARIQNMTDITKLFHTPEQHIDSLLNQRPQSPHARHAEIWRQRRAPIPVEMVLDGGEYTIVNPKELGEEGVLIRFAKCGIRDVDRVIKVL